MPDQMRELKLPADLCELAEKKFGERAGGLEPFLISVLKELLRDDAEQMDRKEQQLIEQRLKDLGYT